MAEFILMYSIAVASVTVGLITQFRSTKKPGLVGHGFLVVAVLSGLYSGVGLTRDLVASRQLSELTVGVYTIVFMVCAIAYFLLAVLARAMGRR